MKLHFQIISFTCFKENVNRNILQQWYIFFIVSPEKKTASIKKVVSLVYLLLLHLHLHPKCKTHRIGCMNIWLISIRHSLTEVPQSPPHLFPLSFMAKHPSQPPSSLSPLLAPLLSSPSVFLGQVKGGIFTVIYRSGGIDLWLEPHWENRSAVKLSERETLTTQKMRRGKKRHFLTELNSKQSK